MKFGGNDKYSRHGCRQNSQLRLGVCCMIEQVLRMYERFIAKPFFCTMSGLVFNWLLFACTAHHQIRYKILPSFGHNWVRR